MEYVKHNEWFEYEHEGKRFRGKYINHGISFMSFALQVEIEEMKSSIFQWTPTIHKSWKTVIECIDDDYRTAHLGNTDRRSDKYPVEKAKKDIIDVIRAYQNDGADNVTYVTILN